MSKIICPFCEMEINENDEKYICPDCQTIYHKECWEVIDGCDKCKEINNTKFVKNQNIEIIQAEPNNVAPINSQLTNSNSPEVVIHNYNEPNTPNKKKKIAVIGIVIAVAIVIVLLIAKSSGTVNGILSISTINFSEKYSYMADEPFCTIASDGSYIELDSNPYDYDNDSYLYIISDYTSEVANAVEQINSDLGFTQALSQKMNQTNALQGKQFEENDKYKVTWTYHPDKGLNVIYEKK